MDPVKTSAGGERYKPQPVGWPWYHNDHVYVIGAIGDGSCFYHSVLKCVCRTYQVLDLLHDYGRMVVWPRGQLKTSVHDLRQTFCDTFRRGLFRWLLEPVPGITVEEARVFLLQQEGVVRLIFDNMLLSPRRPGWRQRSEALTVTRIRPMAGRNVPYRASEIHTLLEELVAEDQAFRADPALGHPLYEGLINTTHHQPTPPEAEQVTATLRLMELSPRNDLFVPTTIELMRQTSANTQEFLDVELLPRLYEVELARQAVQREIANYRLDGMAYSAANQAARLTSYILSAHQALAGEAYVDQVMLATQFARQATHLDRDPRTGERVLPGKIIPAGGDAELPTYNALRAYARAFLNLRHWARDNLLLEPSFDPYTRDEVNAFIRGGPAVVWAHIDRSILRRTGALITPAEAAAMRTMDPRTIPLLNGRPLVNTPCGMAIALNSNFFLMKEGDNLVDYQVTSHEGPTREIEYLMQRIVPSVTGGGINRQDAGATDIVTLMPDILRVNIFLMAAYTNHLRLTQIFQPLLAGVDYRACPCIVIHQMAGHYELFGIQEGDGMQTAFPYEHPFIQAILTFDREREARPNRGNNGVWEDLIRPALPPPPPRPVPLPGVPGQIALPGMVPGRVTALPGIVSRPPVQGGLLAELLRQTVGSPTRETGQVVPRALTRPPISDTRDPVFTLQAATPPRTFPLASPPMGGGDNQRQIEAYAALHQLSIADATTILRVMSMELPEDAPFPNENPDMMEVDVTRDAELAATLAAELEAEAAEEEEEAVDAMERAESEVEDEEKNSSSGDDASDSD